MRLRTATAFFIVVASPCSTDVLAEKAPAGLPPYRNAKLAVDMRVADLLGRMTPAEKVAQLEAVNWDHTYVSDTKTRLFSPAQARKVMPNGIGEVTRPGAKHDAHEATELANAIQKFMVEETRLGIPAILHEEALHGLVGPSATSFPQAIALAATFDPGLVEEIFTVTARQTRARGVSHALAPVGPHRGNLRRRSVPGRAHGRGRCQRSSGPAQVGRRSRRRRTCHGHAQAYDRARLRRGWSQHRACHRFAARPARGLLAALRGCDSRGPRPVGHGQLQ
jgi:hypothetical protein